MNMIGEYFRKSKVTCLNTLKKLSFKVVLLQRRDTEDTQKLMAWSNLTFHLMKSLQKWPMLELANFSKKKTLVYEALDEWGRFEEVLWWYFHNSSFDLRYILM